jgi:hypothetical protein
MLNWDFYNDFERGVSLDMFYILPLRMDGFLMTVRWKSIDVYCVFYLLTVKVFVTECQN